MNIDLDRIKDIAQGVVEQYRKVLADEGINASSTLSNTAEVEVELNGNRLLVSLNLEHYWKYVEYGRRPGKFPPIDAIKGWIKVKPVVPDARTGKVPSEDQLAFLIARKISREGTPARHALNKTVYTDATEAIIQQIKDEIVVQLKQTALSDV